MGIQMAFESIVVIISIGGSILSRANKWVSRCDMKMAGKRDDSVVAQVLCHIVQTTDQSAGWTS